jgi:hypothetical protein
MPLHTLEGTKRKTGEKNLEKKKKRFRVNGLTRSAAVEGRGVHSL